MPDLANGGRIVDATGREVLLRGVNVNSHVEYWQYDEELFTVYAFTEEDADMIASMGWTLVRLLLSWSLVEPTPGVYDETYLDEIAASVAMLRERGVYTLIDLHQDAWNASLAAPPDEVCGRHHAQREAGTALPNGRRSMAAARAVRAAIGNWYLPYEGLGEPGSMTWRAPRA